MTSLSISALLLLAALCGALLYLWTQSRRKATLLAQQLREAEQQLQLDEARFNQRSQLDTIKDEFISTVSHELRTPLTSIRGALGLLSAGLMGSLDPKAHNLLRIAVTNTDRLIRLINDILDLERMESGRASLQLRRCSLSELVTQAVETMAPMAEAAHVSIHFAMEVPPPGSALIQPEADRRHGERRVLETKVPDRRVERRRVGEERRKVNRDAAGTVPSVFFDGDADRILQVLTNLLSNAIKFSPSGSTTTVSLEASPDVLHLRISDQGRGVPQEKLEAIFDRFQQVEATDSRQKGGTGLGLAICRTIVHQHGGAIWAQRNAATGVSLCVDLPRINRATDQLPSATRNEIPVLCDRLRPRLRRRFRGPYRGRRTSPPPGIFRD